MRTLKFIIAFLIAAAIVILCFANSGPVEVRLWPDLTDYGVAAPLAAGIPLFAVGLFAGLIGFLLGAAREWAREHRQRSSGRQARREADRMKAKVDEMTRDGEDDTRALAAR